MSGRFFLVTGGSGFLGSALVKWLVSAGERVRVFDDNSRGRAERLAGVRDIDFIQGDVRDATMVAHACRGIDVVCHLAFVNGTEFFYTKPEVVLEVGVVGMINVVNACRSNGVRELILASSSEVYQTPPVVPTDETVPLSIPDPLNPRYSYAGGKIISELIAINYGRKYFDRVIIVRPHNVYGPDMGWEHVVPQFVLRMKALVESQPSGPISFPIQGEGTEMRSFVYIDDFVEGLALAMSRGEHLNIYHIGTMEELTISDVARAVGRYYGRDIRIVPGRLQPGGTSRRCPDTRKLQALGYAPRFRFEDGLAPTALWYDTHSHLHPPKVEQHR